MSTTRAARVAEVRRLRDGEGLLFREVAERMGLAVQTVNQYYNDPDGVRARARKARNDGICIDCGAPTRNGGAIDAPDRCQPCAVNYSKTREGRLAKSIHGVRQWTDAAIFRALRKAARNGIVSTTTYDEMHDADPTASPSRPLIITRFGRWSAAAEAAGLHTRNGGYGPRSDRTPDRGLLIAIDDCVCDLRLDRSPTYSEYEEWARDRGVLSGSTIRNRFGGWMAATDAYEAEFHMAAAA